jgi:Protein of unknown function (DUF1549)/Protein of unknown function (DUF1553)
MRVRRSIAAILAFSSWLLTGSANLHAATPVANDIPSAARAPDSHAMARRVDDLVEQMWSAAGVQPAPPADDSEFLRRAYLDLVGVIPRVAEVREYLADDRPDKRSLLIDRLLSSPRHATHMATIVRNRILPLGVDPTHDREALGLQKWLRTRFAKNLRYDNLVGGLLLTSGGDELGPALYFRAHDLAPEKMAASASELFLGVKLQCAECHDHPFADWKQRDFWGVAAFFSRIQAPNDRQMMNNPYRLIDGERGEVKIPNSEETVPPKYLGGDVAEDDRWQSRRAQFTTWMASSENRWFARAAVNWTWGELFGQGLVDSLDRLDETDTSHRVQLLNELSQYFAHTGFDLRELWRTLAVSRAYQLSSCHGQAKSPPPELFAYKLPRPLTPEQMYDSVTVLVPRDVSGQEWNRTATSIDEDPMRMEFVRVMRPPPGSATEFRGSTLQALEVMNGRTMADVTKPESNRLLAALDAPFMTDEDRTEAIYLAVLSRKPETDEHAGVSKMLAECKTPQDRRQVQSDLLWALVNSTEFAFNR